jgi:hypothetical protein
VLVASAEFTVMAGLAMNRIMKSLVELQAANGELMESYFFKKLGHNTFC